MPNMPNMPIMPNMPTPQKTPMGATPPSRRGKESATPFYPDAGRIAPIYARVLSLSLMSALLLAPAFAAPALGSRFKLHTVLSFGL